MHCYIHLKQIFETLEKKKGTSKIGILDYTLELVDDIKSK